MTASRRTFAGVVVLSIGLGLVLGRGVGQALRPPTPPPTPLAAPECVGEPTRPLLEGARPVIRSETSPVDADLGADLEATAPDLPDPGHLTWEWTRETEALLDAALEGFEQLPEHQLCAFHTCHRFIRAAPEQHERILEALESVGLEARVRISSAPIGGGDDGYIVTVARLDAETHYERDLDIYCERPDMPPVVVLGCEIGHVEASETIAFRRAYDQDPQDVTEWSE